MSQTSYTFKLDHDVLECFKRVSDSSVHSRNAYIQRVLIEHLQGIHQLPDDFSPIGDGRGAAAKHGGRRSKGLVIRDVNPGPSDLKGILMLQSNYAAQYRTIKPELPNKQAIAALKNHPVLPWMKVAQLNGVIVGAIGCFPVCSSDIGQVLTGEIAPDDLTPDVDGDVAFISGINIDPHKRGHRHVICGLLASVADTIGKLSPTTIYSQPISLEGVRMAEHLEMCAVPGQTCKIKESGEPEELLYERRVTLQDIENTIARFH